MLGPNPVGFWSSRSRQARWPLELDRVYRVKRPFVDFDGHQHPIGETWQFLGSAFLPYDDGLSLFVRHSGGEWHIRLQLSQPQQAAVWENFSDHVEAA
jgi:hypothetical protein